MASSPIRSIRVAGVTFLAVVSLIALAVLSPSQASAAESSDPRLAASGDQRRTVSVPAALPAASSTSWLSVVNEYRRQAGLAPVTENTSGTSAARNHSCWMVKNDIAHSEIPGTPGYTPEGNNAAARSNVAVSSTAKLSDRKMIDLWMTGPFHAIGILRPTLQNVAYARCDGSGPYWKSAATLNVLDGLDRTRPRPSQPITWPGNGTTTNLTTFVAEKPNPVELCGWSGTAGLPVIAMFQNTVSSPSGSMIGPDGKTVQTCTLWYGNVDDAAGRSILGGENAVIVVPKLALKKGTYRMRVTSGGQTVNWSFTVKP